MDKVALDALDAAYVGAVDAVRLTQPARTTKRRPRVWLYGVIPLLLIGFAGCGSGSPTALQDAKEPPLPGVETGASEASLTTSASRRSGSEPNTSGAPSFTINLAEPDGDKVAVDGWFGPVVLASQSSVSQTALSECPQPAPYGRAMVTQLDIATTVQSSLAAEVELKTNYVVGLARTLPKVNFIMGYSEGAHCDNGQPGLANVKLGQLQPDQTDHFTMWVVLPGAITPDRSTPTEQQLGGEIWLMALPVASIMDSGSTANANEQPKVTVSGPRIVTCETPGSGLGSERSEYLAVSNDTPKTLVNEAPCPE